MLAHLFAWFDRTPAAYWVLAGLPSLLLLGWVIADLWRTRAATADQPEVKRSEFAFCALMVLVIFAWRWPFLLNARDFSPDEAQQVAGALTLWRDPVFWRSVDGATGGPLDFYALLPLHALGVPIDYFNARLTGLLLVSGALVATYRVLRREYPAAVARLGVLPGLWFFAATSYVDFIYYTTEHVPLFLVAIAFGLVWRHRRPAATAGWFEPGWLLAGVVAGLAPWAKLQAAPLSALVVAIGMTSTLCDSSLAPGTRWRRALSLVVAATVPTLLGLALVGATGQFEAFSHGYLLQNMNYANSGGDAVGTLRRFAEQMSHSPLFVALFVAAAVMITGELVVLLRTRRRPGALFLVALSFVGVALFTATFPRRAFPHYLLFLIVPLTLAVGATLGEMWKRLGAGAGRLAYVTVVLLGCGLLPLILKARQETPFMIGVLGQSWREPLSPVSRAIMEHARSDDTLAIWGWVPAHYVETGLPQAVRDGHILRCIEASPYRDYFYQRFVSDLRRSRPALFVDAVGLGAVFLSDRQRYGHQAFPEVRDFVRENYTRVREIEYARIYVRKDRIEPQK